MEGVSTYLHNIDVVLIKYASKCFFVCCNNVILHKGYIVTTNETFVCKKRLNKFPETIIVYSFFRDAFSKIFCITTRICFLASFMPIHFPWKGLDSFCFSICFLCRYLFEILRLQKESGCLLKLLSLTEHDCLQPLEIYLRLMNNCFQNFPHLI